MNFRIGAAALVAAMLSLSVAHAATPYTCKHGDNAPAINALLAAGGDVELAPGICGLAEGLTMTVPGTTLNGSGIGKTTLFAQQPNTIDVVTVGTQVASQSTSGFTLSNLSINSGLLVPVPPNPTVGRNIVINGTVHADASNAWGLNITNVESRNSVDGLIDHGSDITAVGFWSHNNRHSGFFVMGLVPFGPVYGIAHNITLKASRAENNNLDNQPGQTWDDVNTSRFVSNVTIGGPNPGDGNSVIGGDILLGCPPTYPQCPGQPTGPFLVQGNTVTNMGPVQSMGIRAYGFVTQADILDNTITVGSPSTGGGFFGGVTNSQFSGNTVNGGTAWGILIQPISGYPDVGDGLLVDSNNVTMGSANHPAVSVQQATNVTVSNNVANGSPYDTATAGAGLVMSNNQ